MQWSQGTYRVEQKNQLRIDIDCQTDWKSPFLHIARITFFNLDSMQLSAPTGDEPYELTFRRINTDELFPPTRLTGTRWELAGVVDAKTGKITPLAPAGSYWFKFVSETKAQGRSVFNDMEVYLQPRPIIWIVTKVGDDHNGDAALFYSIIERIESYSWEKNELKFFYDNKTHYLLYRYVLCPCECMEEKMPIATLKNESARIRYRRDGDSKISFVLDNEELTQGRYLVPLWCETAPYGCNIPEKYKQDGLPVIISGEVFDCSEYIKPWIKRPPIYFIKLSTIKKR